MKLNMSQAAKAVGKDRKTLYRHAEKGKLTVGKDGNGNPVIDVAELERVYGSLNLNATPDTVGKIGAKPQNDTPKKSNDNSALKREIEIRDEKISALENERARERETSQIVISDLREDRDRWRAQAEQATRLLTDDRNDGEKRYPKLEAVVAVVLILAIGFLVFQYWPVLIR